MSRFDLMAMSPEELARVDIAAMNLACAEGLPGFDGTDSSSLIRQIDEWANRVEQETKRHLYRVQDPRYAEHYHNSESYLRVELLIQTLQEDCGVRYNPERIHAPDFGDSRDLFIHGLLGPKLGGTCASMPVLYAAVGRRLGYPIKLVSAREHLFCRWASSSETFNIEGSSNGGWDPFPDEHYRTWPKPISQEQVDRGEYLKSMTPTEELANFLFTRGICEANSNRTIAGRASIAEAHRLAPQMGAYLFNLVVSTRATGNLQPFRPDAGYGSSRPMSGAGYPENRSP